MIRHTKKTQEQGAVATESELQDEHVFVVLAADGTVNVNDKTVSVDSYDTLLDILKDAISQMDNSELVLDAPDNVNTNMLWQYWMPQPGPRSIKYYLWRDPVTMVQALIRIEQKVP